MEQEGRISIVNFVLFHVGILPIEEVDNSVELEFEGGHSAQFEKVDEYEREKGIVRGLKALKIDERSDQ